MAKRQIVYSAEAPIMGNYRKRKVVEGVLYLELQGNRLKKFTYNTDGNIAKRSTKRLSPLLANSLSRGDAKTLKDITEKLTELNTKI